MFTNIGVSAFFVILAVAVFIFLCFKNVHTGIAATIAAFIAAFGSTETLAVSMFSTFTEGVGSLVAMMFMVFTASGLFAYLMDVTGCAMSVGKTMVNKLGVDRSYLAITATTVILLVAGVGTYTMVVVVLAIPLMKAANLPKKVGMIAALGIAPAISFCMPIANVPASLPNIFLPTTIFDAPVLSIATGCVGIVLFFFWITHMVKKARANNEGFDGGDDVGELDTDMSKLPSFATALIPLIVVIVAAIFMAAFKVSVPDMPEPVAFFEVVLGVNSNAQVALAQLAGCVVLVALHFNRCKEVGFTKIISQGAPSMWGFLVLAGCVFGFGQVVSKCAAFAPVQEWVLGLQFSPYISAMISVAIVAALCTDGISAMMIWLPMFGQTYLDMGVNPGALRRLLLCTTQTFDSLPHAQSTAITLGVYGLTHKQAYWDMFVTTVIFPTIFSIFCCICCIIFY